MTFPDACPNCGAVLKANQLHSDRRNYACGTWIIESRKGVYASKTDTCCDWRTIKDAAAVIRELVDKNGNGMSFPLLIEKAEEWLKDNAP